jgi:hypothetical protein
MEDLMEKYTLADLTGIYVRVNIPTTVYWGTGQKAWEYGAGAVVGKVYSWVDNRDGEIGTLPKLLFLMFYVEAGRQGAGTAYYIPLQPRMLDWEFFREQIFSWFERQTQDFGAWVDSVEASIEKYYEESIVQPFYKGLKWGGIALGGVVVVWLGWELWVKPEIIARPYKKVIREFGKGLNA